MMLTPEVLRRRAEDCRRAALRSGKRPRTSHYLIDLAEHYEGQAAKLEAWHSGDKPPQPTAQT